MGWDAETQKALVEWYQLFDSVRRWVETVLNVAMPPLPTRFVEGLQDGIVLCYLSRAIDERSIPRIQENKARSYKLRENITFFLAACKDFGVPANRIFAASDVASKRVVRVVETLAELARRVVQPPPEGTGFAVALESSSKPMDIKAITALCGEAELDAVVKQMAAMKRTGGKGGAHTSALVARAQLRLITGQGSCLCKAHCRVAPRADDSELSRPAAADGVADGGGRQFHSLSEA